MTRSTLPRGASIGALSLIFASAALAQGSTCAGNTRLLQSGVKFKF